MTILSWENDQAKDTNDRFLESSVIDLHGCESSFPTFIPGKPGTSGSC